MGYKDRPLEERLRDINIIRQRYPDRIPIIVDKAKFSRDDIPKIDKTKYLCPDYLSLGQFIYIIRRQLQLPADKAIFLYINNTFIPSSILMRDIYAQHRSHDGFLYATYSGESTFGSLPTRM